jgi:hypothetical protein
LKVHQLVHLEKWTDFLSVHAVFTCIFLGLVANPNLWKPCFRMEKTFQLWYLFKDISTGSSQCT